MSSSILESLINGRGPMLEPISVERYHRMIAAGILPEGAPIELIDGLLVRKDRSDQEAMRCLTVRVIRSR